MIRRFVFKKVQTSLAGKIGSMVASSLILVFVILITITYRITQMQLTNAISQEMQLMAKKNAIQFQSMLHTVEVSLDSITSFVDQNWSGTGIVDGKIGNPVQQLEMGVVCETPLTAENKRVEDFLIELALSAVNSNEDLFGIGIFFSEYGFQNNIKDYSFYITPDSTRDTLAICRDSEKYVNEIYYAEAAERKGTVVTEPYNYNGVDMITIATPIVRDGQVKAVIGAYVSYEKLSDFEIDQSNYPSLMVYLYSDEEKLCLEVCLMKMWEKVYPM